MKKNAYSSTLEMPEVDTLKVIALKDENLKIYPMMGVGACGVSGCACTAFDCDYPGSAGDHTLCTVDGCGHEYQYHNDPN